MIKKYTFIYICSLTLSILAGSILSACSDEAIENQTDTAIVQEVPTEVCLSLNSSDRSQQTRAAISSAADSKIYNLWIYVFDAEGRNGQLFRYQNPEDKVTFTVKSGERRIYALANVDEATDRVTFSHDLSAITDVKTLHEAMATLTTETVFRNSGHLLMSGIYDAKEQASTTEGSCIIQPLGHVTLAQPLMLQRMDARITFNISLDASDPEVLNKKFTPVSWQVFNAPTGVSLFAEEESLGTKFFSMPEAKQFENIEKNAKTGLDVSSFTFYALENNHRGTGASQWSDREMKEKDAAGINTSVFKNAPKNATYVKLTGTYSYDFTDPKTGNPAHQNAYVEHTIHLGYVGQDAYNNYECKRNTNYTYNILVRGVDDIILKVDTENGPNGGEDGSSDIGNGGEGDVVVASYFFDFDAHYDRSILHFNKQFMEQHPELQGFYVNTPFDEGSYYLDDIETPYKAAQPASKAIDYEWIKFRRCDMKSDSIYNGTSFSYYDPNNVIDIKQLLHDLRTGRDKNGFTVYDKHGDAYYTLFIEENYYTHDPRTGEKGATDFWKKFVNQKPREMYIFCQTDHSLDNQSSVTKGNIQIRQRSIHTHYDIKAPATLKTAWGVETRNETGLVTAEIVNPLDAVGLTPDNAIKNQMILLNLIGKNWYTFLSTDMSNNDYHNQLNDNSEYSTFLYACVQRNRDENGNGIIDREELKWIPASSRHYNELWVGNSSLPNDVRLYPMGSRDNRRYLSSNGEEFLAEEGASYAPYGTLSNEGYMGLARPSRYDYRCIRLLGYDFYENDEIIPQSFAQVNEEKHQISLDWLDAESKRTPDFKISEDTEEGDHASFVNYPYNVFQYCDVDITTNEIPAGWRLPNNREMTLMLMCLPDGWGNPSSLTFYPTSTIAAPYLSGKKGCTHYGVCEPKSDGTMLRYMTLPLTKPNYLVRCVKDVY